MKFWKQLTMNMASYVPKYITPNSSLTACVEDSEAESLSAETPSKGTPLFKLAYLIARHYHSRTAKI